MAETTKYKIERERRRLASAIPQNLRLPAEVLSKYTQPSDVSNVPARCGLLSDRDLEINAWDAVQVRDRIAARQVAAVEVASAFAKRTAIAHQLTCCLCDYFIDEALTRARELDEFQQRTGKVVGPLHGVPCSLKDHVQLSGRAAPAGMAAWIERIPEEDAAIVKLLRHAGAVFFVKTSQPQTGMHVETHNFIGRTLNPFNTALSAGGSSGGEGALIAMKGSCLGVGTDIGGSIRVPAGNCGLWGFKPSPNLLPIAGIRLYDPGAKAITFGCGPIASSRRSLALFLSSILSQAPHLQEFTLHAPSSALTDFDALCRPPQLGRRLRVGVMHGDTVVQPHPPIRRAMRYLEDRLKRGGQVEVVTYQPLQHGFAQRLMTSLFAADGQETTRDLLGDEEMVPLTARVLRNPPPPLTLREYNKKIAERDAYRAAYARHWVDSGIDVLLCPIAHHPAPPHDTSGYVAYTAHWNLLGYPAAVFPTGLRVDPELDRPDQNVQPLNKLDAKLQKSWSPEISKNAPLGLQMVARPWEDALLMQSLAVIEAALA